MEDKTFLFRLHVRYPKPEPEPNITDKLIPKTWQKVHNKLKVLSHKALMLKYKH